MRPASVTLPPTATLSTLTASATAAPSTLSSTRTVPARIEWQALSCPACAEALDLDRDGTSCTRCRGLLVQRVWAERLLPTLGRPTLPPVFQPAPRELSCPGCRRAMSPVLVHGVAAWSCAACRWLFLEGPRSRQLMQPDAPVAASPARSLEKASLLHVATERARDVAASPRLRDALGILVLVALVVAVLVVETAG